jgi:hypothetical protein
MHYPNTAIHVNSWNVDGSKYKSTLVPYCEQCDRALDPKKELEVVEDGNRKKSLCKYCQKRVVKFDSKKEYARFRELRLLEAFGDIKNLERQVKYPVVAKDWQGKDYVITTYIADFRYTEKNGNVVVEDAKGFITPMYRFKKRLLKNLLNIEIKET